MNKIQNTQVAVEGFAIEVERVVEFDKLQDCNVVTYTFCFNNPKSFTWCEDEDCFANVDAAGNATMKREMLQAFAMGLVAQQ